MNEFTAAKVGENAYALTGALSGAVLTPFLSTLTGEKRWALDCAEVESINFSGIRALLNAGDEGKYFDIINANAAVAELFEATGASRFISVSRAPVEVELSQWVLSGGGHMAESYDSMDGDAMMKLYRGFAPREYIEQEKRLAQAVFLMGIPTPMPGEMVHCGDRWGCTFERLANKRSFSRALSQEPERIEEYAFRFAKLCKKLHQTPCNKAVFPSVREKTRQTILNLEYFSDEEKQTLLDFTYGIEDTGTCLHGDLHMGNVITDGNVDLFIDLGDFAYGNPIFDVSALYFAAYYMPEPICRAAFHISTDTFRQFWKHYVKIYFDADTPAKSEEVERMMKPYMAFAAMMTMERDSTSAQPISDVVRSVMPYMKG